MTDKSAEDLCLNVYAETLAFYKEIQPLMGHRGFGFKILYGPPLFKPPILFLGYQPGGSSEDDKREQAGGAHERWPAALEYATQDWTLARNMQKMFGPDRLARCVGLNALFFRAPDLKEWEKLPRELRIRIESFCKGHATGVIRALQPDRVVAIGFKTLELFGPTKPDISNEKGRVLTKSGTVAGYPSLGTLHLSGAQISNVDRERITQRIGLR